MFDYPKKLDFLFGKLLEKNIRPIIVGGYVRDFFLKKESKDIDIELYGLSSFKKLEKILQDFGSVNSVGKSFGVCKLNAFGLDLDFSLPRLDSKFSSGHKGFNIKIDSNLDYNTASSRRDFTINSIGYDIQNKKILDPHKGLEDLKHKILRAVDSTKFVEDPLRVLRAVQFSARFNFTLDKELFILCKKMLSDDFLSELPKERIFEELKKVLLKAQKPSAALELLQELGAIKIFSGFSQLLKDFDFIAQKKLTHKQESKILYALSEIINGDNIQAEVLNKISKDLHRVVPLLQGRDLIKLGIKPSKEFGDILQNIYLAQISGSFSNHKEGIKYLKEKLSL